MRESGAWRRPAYRLYWTTFTLSSVGSTMAAYALPMVVVVTLHGGPQDTARLAVAQSLGALLGAVASGFTVTPGGSRQVMIAADIVRFLVQGAVPVLDLAGALMLWHLYAAAFVVALCSSFFGAAQAVVLPRILAEGEIAEANAKLWLGIGASLVAGPVLAGALAELTSPSAVIGIDGLTYVASAMAIRRLRDSGQAHDLPSPGVARHVVLESVAWSWRQRSVSALLACRLGVAAFTGMAGTVAMYYRLGELGLSPAVVGLLATLTSPGFLIGPVATGLLVRHFGPGRVALAGALLLGLGSLALPAARGGFLAVCTILVFGGILADMGALAYQAMDETLLQTIVPVERRPQVVAFGNVLTQLGGIVGPVVGFVLSHSLPAVAILWISGAGLLLSPIPMALTPLIQRNPPVADEARVHSETAPPGGPVAPGAGAGTP